MVVVSGQCIRITVFRDKHGTEHSSIRLKENNDVVWNFYIGRVDFAFKEHSMSKLMEMRRVYISTSASDNGSTVKKITLENTIFQKKLLPEKSCGHNKF